MVPPTAVIGTGKQTRKRDAWETDADGWKEGKTGSDPQKADPPKLKYEKLIVLLISAPLLRRLPGKDIQVLAPLSVRREVLAIERAFKARNAQQEFELRVEIATYSGLQRVFSAESLPSIIHFIGHGAATEPECTLIFEGDFGEARHLSPYDLEKIVSSIGRPPCQLAVLNACHSETLAQVLANYGVPHVIAINSEDEILDVAARAFSRAFYPALMGRRSVGAAFKSGRAGIYGDDAVLRVVGNEHKNRWEEALKIELLPKDSVAHQKPLDLERMKGELKISPAWENTNLTPLSSAPFVGRQTEIYSLNESLSKMSERCICIQGMGGMGKTSLADAVGRWQHERGLWDSGVWVVRLGNVATSGEARQQISAQLSLGTRTGKSNESLQMEIGDWNCLLILDDLDLILREDTDRMCDLLNSLLGFPQLQLLLTARGQIPGTVVCRDFILERMDRASALAAFKQYASDFEDLSTGANPADLKWLLDFLDGYPFPIRLAATFLKQHRCTITHLRERLEENAKRVLKYSGLRESSSTSFYATLDLSFINLSDRAQELFPVLSLFPAGLTHEAVQNVLGAEAIDVLELLAQASMLEMSDPGSSRRFSLPEPARKYAESKCSPDLIRLYGDAALKYFAGRLAYGLELLRSADQQKNGRTIVALDMANTIVFLEWGLQNESRKPLIAGRLMLGLLEYWTSVAAEETKPIFERVERTIAKARQVGDENCVGHLYYSRAEMLVAYKDYSAALSSFAVAISIYDAEEVARYGVLARFSIIRHLTNISADFQNVAVPEYFGSATISDLARVLIRQAAELFQQISDQFGRAEFRQKINSLNTILTNFKSALNTSQRVLSRSKGKRFSEFDRKLSILRDAVNTFSAGVDDLPLTLTNIKTAANDLSRAMTTSSPDALFREAAESSLRQLLIIQLEDKANSLSSSISEFELICDAFVTEIRPVVSEKFAKEITDVENFSSLLQQLKIVLAEFSQDGSFMS
jgi:predicted ATPase